MLARRALTSILVVAIVLFVAVMLARRPAMAALAAATFAFVDAIFTLVEVRSVVVAAVVCTVESGNTIDPPTCRSSVTTMLPRLEIAFAITGPDTVICPVTSRLARVPQLWPVRCTLERVPP